MAFLRQIGWQELLIVLVIAVLIFGPGRIGKIGSELGKSIRGFRDNVKSKDAEDTSDDTHES